MSCTRRRVLGSGAAAVAITALGGATPATAASVPQPGIQLYTLRDAMQQDVPYTLKRVAAIGYRTVEFAGYFGRKPDEIARLLTETGLAAPSAHVGALDARDAPMPLIEGALVAGHKFLVIAWTPPETRKTLDDWKAWADTCNRFAGQCAKAGLSFCYHNHDFEFRAVDGRPPYDVLLERTDPALVGFELDLYWAKLAGADLSQLLSAHRGRFPMCHVKDMAADGTMADIGRGTIDFTGLFARKDIDPFRYYFFENDTAKNPWESAEISYKALTRILDSLDRHVPN
jgi:sugar phosphate isomerase/epimerase